MGRNLSLLQGDTVSDDAGRHPVERVTWEDAQAFVAALSLLEHTRAGGDADIP